MKFQSFFRFLRWLVVPVVLILCVLDIQTVWYYKVAIVCFILSGVVNDYRVGAYREEIKRYKRW